MGLERVGLAAFGDVASILMPGLPTGTFTAVVESLYRRHTEAVRDEILRELQERRLTVEEAAAKEPFIAGLLRIRAAIAQGEAEYNLRLLGRALVGQLEHEEPSEESFNRYVPILTRIHRELAFVVGRYVALMNQERASGRPDREDQRMQAWHRLQEEATERYGEGSALEAYCGEAVGLGLLVAASGFGTLTYRPAPLAYELAELNCLRDDEAATRL